jgi:hypothetical protein
MRTVKPCGPVPPTLGSIPRVEEPGETEANKPGTPGRSRSSRSTIAQGVPDVSALPVVTTACVHHYPSCTRGCGCGQRPAFPAPSFFKGDLRCKARTRNRAAGMLKLGCLTINPDGAASADHLAPRAGRGRAEGAGEGESPQAESRLDGTDSSNPTYQHRGDRVPCPSPGAARRPLPAMRGEVIGACGSAFRFNFQTAARIPAARFASEPCIFGVPLNEEGAGNAGR